MNKTVVFAYLKTIDGEEVMEHSKREFDAVVNAVSFRKVTKSDRTLYFVKDTMKYNGIKYFKDDYFEVCH